MLADDDVHISKCYAFVYISVENKWPSGYQMMHNALCGILVLNVETSIWQIKIYILPHQANTKTLAYFLPPAPPPSPPPPSPPPHSPPLPLMGNHIYFRISLGRDKNKWGEWSLLLISWCAPDKVRYQSLKFDCKCYITPFSSCLITIWRC